MDTRQCGLYCQDAGKSVLLCAVDTLSEKNLLNTLVELDAAVQAMPSANPKLDLLKLFARIDELAKQLPRDADPTLLHYLHKKSYQKARLFLQGREAGNAAGNGRHLN
ncbi:MAG: hypothetical protein WBN22_10475 [Verrucomicrobiia bacterium]